MLHSLFLYLMGTCHPSLPSPGTYPQAGTALPTWPLTPGPGKSQPTVAPPLALVQSLSHVRLFATPRTSVGQASLSITSSWRLLKLRPIESVMPSNHLILCHPLLLLPSIFPRIRVFSVSQLFVSGDQGNFSFTISPSKEYSGLISFRMDWLDLLASPRVFSRVFSNTTVRKHQ